MKLTNQSYIKTDGCVKAVLCSSARAWRARLILNGAAYADAFNDAEPYDLHTHVFYIPEAAFREGEAVFCWGAFKNGRRDCEKRVELRVEAFADEAALLEEYDHGLKIIKAEPETVAEGLVFTKFTCADREGLPVIFSLLETDLRHTALYVGTPQDGYAARKVKATIPDMAAAAGANGKTVLAAVNADFFDIFGDGHPSGLCVKNGRVIANETSTRPFLGVKKDGIPVLTDIIESPGIVGELQQAAAGLQMIVKDGKLYDWAPLEPFSSVRHPRTAAGLTSDGRVLLLEADGRIPAHSNGATLVDLGKFMISLGAVRAVNLDGGGSSAVYIKTADGFQLKTVPADLFFPNDMLIRKDFNAFLIVDSR
jgi:hypothetical protein